MTTPHCSRCDKQHYNFMSCEKAVEKQKTQAPEHWVRPGSPPWGNGFDYYSTQKPMPKARRLNNITSSRKEPDGT